MDGLKAASDEQLLDLPLFCCSVPLASPVYVPVFPIDGYCSRSPAGAVQIVYQRDMMW